MGKYAVRRLLWMLVGMTSALRLDGIPGIGRQAFQAVQTQDLPPIKGTVLFAALLVTLSNFVVDLASTWLDPRVKYS